MLSEAKHLAHSIATRLERREILRPFARTQNDTGLRRVLNDVARRNRVSVTPPGETADFVTASIWYVSRDIAVVFDRLLQVRRVEFGARSSVAALSCIGEGL